MGKATRDAYGEVLKELGGENPDIVVLDADLSSSTKTRVFAKAYPDRFFNIGAGRAYEQIRNSICYPKLNVKIAVTHSGLTVGEDGATHQMLEDISLMRALPNMTVIVPADGEETKAAVCWAASYHGPV